MVGNFRDKELKLLELYLFGDQGKKKLRFIKAEELDKKFDAGEDIIDNLDLSKAKRPGLKTKRVSVDFPT